MDATLNNIAAQPIYVLLFVAFMGFLWQQHRASVATAVQAEAIKSALTLAAAGQTEANRLRDESNRQNERWLNTIETMNERFIMAITGQTGAMTRQAARLDTIDTGLSGIPALATGAAVSVVGANVDIALRILKALDINVDDLAKHASHPTAGTKEKVDLMANKAEQKTPSPADPAPPKPGDDIQVTGTVIGTVTGTVAPAGTPS